MATIRAIRTHIKTVTNTQQITKAMKMVSVSKLRRTKAAMMAMRPFTEKSGEILDTLLSGGGYENRFLAPRKEIKKVCYVLFVGNRGLCGAYNSNIMRYMAELAAKETHDYSVVVLGRWGKDVIRRINLPVLRTFDDVSDTPTAQQGIEIAEYLKDMYLSGEADKVVLVYQKFKNALSQIPVNETLLPASMDRKESDTAASGGSGYLFEPDQATILENVLQLYINNTVYSALLEAKSGEHSTRMTAMTSASDNTDELIGELNLKLNRARQAQITTEISEIVGGTAALKKKK
jgi:F-type H+-transporting ATPase subunit gamma